VTSVCVWLCTWLCMVSESPCDSLHALKHVWGGREDQEFVTKCRTSSVLRTLAKEPPGQPVLPRPSPCF
jgi:hypothetical protein